VDTNQYIHIHAYIYKDIHNEANNINNNRNRNKTNINIIMHPNDTSPNPTTSNNNNSNSNTNNTNNNNTGTTAITTNRMDVETLHIILQQSFAIETSIRQPAEEYIRNLKHIPGATILLLQVVAEKQVCLYLCIYVCICVYIMCGEVWCGVVWCGCMYLLYHIRNYISTCVYIQLTQRLAFFYHHCDYHYRYDMKYDKPQRFN
jgi:hypothetical protein